MKYPLILATGMLVCGCSHKKEKSGFVPYPVTRPSVAWQMIPPSPKGFQELPRFAEPMESADIKLNLAIVQLQQKVDALEKLECSRSTKKATPCPQGSSSSTTAGFPQP
jgi:hypothetical protein